MQLGRTAEEPGLFIATIHGRTTPPVSELAIISSIVDHAQGKEPPVPGFAFGLDGYRLWLEAVHSGNLDLQGHAYQVAILAEARHHAALYLQILSGKVRNVERAEKLAQAAACYRRVHASFNRLYPSFPFGYGNSMPADWLSLMMGSPMPLRRKRKEYQYYRR